MTLRALAKGVDVGEHGPSTVFVQGPGGTPRLTMRWFLPATADVVWAHLTRRELLAQWSPCVPDRDITGTGAYELREQPGGEAVSGDVLICDEAALLVHRWGDLVVGWHVTVEGRSTELNMVQTCGSEEVALDCAAGWHLCLAVLAARLAGVDAPRIVGADALEHGWHELRANYAGAAEAARQAIP